MNKKRLADEIVKRLENAYPQEECFLDHTNAWQLVVAVRLAAQCTDVRVNIVTKELFASYASVGALAKATPEEIEKIIRPCGLGKTKARDIHLAMNHLQEKYDGSVPDTMEQLLEIPGVGRKSANLILGDVFNKPAIVTDTHCIRLCKKFGLTSSTNPAVTERELREVIEPEKGNAFCHRLVRHGREVCTARSPKCSVCLLNDICVSGIRDPN